MIITEEVEVKIGGGNINHFKNLGYNVKPKDKIIIPVEHLSKGSHVKIRVRCDICGKEKEIEYREYIRSFNKYKIYACSPKCAQIKNRKTKQEKYGDPYYRNSKKCKQTKKEKYDDENYVNPEKAKQTNLNLYGVENVFQSEKIKLQIKETMRNLYGVEYPLQNKEFSKKQIETMTGLLYEEYLEQLPDYKRYKNEVWKITRKQPFLLLENYEKRGIREYHLDHKYSMKEGFINNILPHIIGNIVNLEMLTWEDNISKCDRCSISKEELFELYDKSNIVF